MAGGFAFGGLYLNRRASHCTRFTFVSMTLIRFILHSISRHKFKNSRGAIYLVTFSLGHPLSYILSNRDSPNHLLSLQRSGKLNFLLASYPHSLASSPHS
jgi:hypothetical protein